MSQAFIIDLRKRIRSNDQTCWLLDFRKGPCALKRVEKTVPLLTSFRGGQWSSGCAPAGTAFSGFRSRLGGCWADPGKLRSRDDLIAPRVRMTLSHTETPTSNLSEGGQDEIDNKMPAGRRRFERPELGIRIQ